MVRSSEHRLAVNRRNAARSTGPRTPEGKAVVALNALKHGLLSREALVKGESEAELVAFGKRMRAQLAPGGELELLLADRVVSTAWRLRRAVALEAVLLGEKGTDGSPNPLTYYCCVTSEANTLIPLDNPGRAFWPEKGVESRIPLVPLAPADQHLVRGGLERDGEAQETLEGGGRRAASIEAEHELVEVGLEVLSAQAVVDAEPPPLRVREHAVDPRQHQVGRRVADHLRVVLDVRERGVPGPAVADDGAARDDVAGDERVERGGRVVPDHRQPDPARPLAHGLDRPRDQELALVRSAGLGRDRAVLGAKGEAGLVHLHQARQRLALGIDHRPAELAEQQPGGLVGAEPELQPQLPGRHPVPVRRDQPRRQEPELERQVA